MKRFRENINAVTDRIELNRLRKAEQAMREQFLFVAGILAGAMSIGTLWMLVGGV